jgi:hypothetical protein
MLHEILELLIAYNLPIAKAVEMAVARANQEGFNVTITHMSNYELATFLKAISHDLIVEQKDWEERVRNH